MFVYGIDPGYDRLGISVVEIGVSGEISIKDLLLLHSSKHKDFFRRIQKINADFKNLVQKYLPSYIFMEDLYWGRNVSTALKVGMIIGSLISVVPENTKIYKVHPSSVKKYITGNGKAGKKAILVSLEKQLNIKLNAIDDVVDALAIAYYGIKTKLLNSMISSF